MGGVGGGGEGGGGGGGGGNPEWLILHCVIARYKVPGDIRTKIKYVQI